MLKKIISVAISAIAVSCIVGCSNQSPVSVADNMPTTTAALSSVPMRDIAAYGNYIWGLHATEKVGNNDYKIYSFNTSTNQWVQTSHWGTRICATTNGTCYHINSENRIWWCTATGNGEIPKPPQSGTFTDIGAGTITGGGHSIWVLISGSYIYRYTTVGPEPGWRNMTPSGITAYKSAIACDPGAGECAAFICNDIQGLWYFNGYNWILKNRGGYDTDVGIAGAWTLLPDCYGTLRKNFRNNVSVLINSGVNRSGITGDENYYYYLNSQGYVQRGVNTWN